jgi:hypothetical protein
VCSRIQSAASVVKRNTGEEHGTVHMNVSDSAYDGASNLDSHTYG